jgi:hypothetical protein
MYRSPGCRRHAADHGGGAGTLAALRGVAARMSGALRMRPDSAPAFEG